jgi:predicted TIM-barrel fold metal-dependent hydrolase
MATPHRIDVHHHIIPPGYLKGTVGDAVFRQAGGRVPPILQSWTPEVALKVMDESGIATAMTSISAPGIWYGNVEESRRLSREFNEYATKLARDHPGRFGTLLTIPLPDVEGSLREIEYGFDTLKADGVCFMTSYANKWPGEKEFAPVFDELNRRGAVVYFHPLCPDCCKGLITDVPDSSVEFMFDTVRAVMSLLYSGTFTRCSKIRFIFSHTGSAVPLLNVRMAGLVGWNKKLADRLPNGPAHELKKLFYETAGSARPEYFAPLMNLVTTDQVLFGTDYPWGGIMMPKDIVEGLARLGFSSDDLMKIERGNALKLFPQLGKR